LSQVLVTIFLPMLSFPSLQAGINVFFSMWKKSKKAMSPNLEFTGDLAPCVRSRFFGKCALSRLPITLRISCPYFFFSRTSFLMTFAIFYGRRRSPVMTSPPVFPETRAVGSGIRQTRFSVLTRLRFLTWHKPPLHFFFPFLAASFPFSQLSPIRYKSLTPYLSSDYAHMLLLTPSPVPRSSF